MYIMGSMLRVTVINTLSPEKHFIYKTDLTARFVCNAEHSSQTPTWPCEPWLLLWCQLFHRDPWNGSDEWGPVRLHSLGGLESIQLSVTLPTLTVMNTMQAADNTPIHYEKKKKKKKREIDGKRYVCHPSMLHSSTLPSEDLLGEEMMKSVYTIMWNRRSNIPQLHPLRPSIRLPRCWHFFFFN